MNSVTSGSSATAIIMGDISALPPWSGRERGIPFTGPMVRATLDRRKTMTRRVWDRRLFAWWNVNSTLDDDGWPAACDEHGDWHRLQATYRVGDLLYIRETVQAVELDDTEMGLDCIRYLADDTFRPVENTPEAAELWSILYNYAGRVGSVVPSIHMPKWAARPERLVVTRVRAERVQNISEEDVIAEGCRPFFDYNNPRNVNGIPMADLMEPVDDFSRLWNSIHGPDAWDRNDWVWAYTYAMITADEVQEYRRMVA